MVISSEFQMEQYRDRDYREDALHFNFNIPFICLQPEHVMYLH